MMKNQKGQVLLLLILVMTVALAIGLSIVQKSLVDISTASKIEQSARAFSAAEAGVEKALKGDINVQNFIENKSSIKEIVDTGLIPAVPANNTRQDALEYDSPLAKEDVAQVWLADFSSPINPPPPFYTQNDLDIYWGSSSEDKAAVEVTVIYFGRDQNPPGQTDTISPSMNKYRSLNWYFDHQSADRNPPNRFVGVNCTGNYTPQGATTSYQCKKTLTALPSGLKLLRARLLYNTTSQPFAVSAVGTCGRACSLPPQKRVIVSTGAAGETQRRVRVSQFLNVVPFYFNYALFSAGDINK